jgi:hypothetical protein
MNSAKKSEWVLFLAASLVLPMPYHALIAAGTMPLIFYLAGVVAAIFSLRISGVFLAVFLVIDFYLLKFICKYLIKLFLPLSDSRLRYAMMFLVFIGLAFIPWHWAWSVNHPKARNTYELIYTTYVSGRR